MRLSTAICIIIFTLFSYFPQLRAQVSTRAFETVIPILSSDGYSGRSNVKEGNKKAAKFLLKRLDKLPKTTVFSEKFDFPINEFSDSLYLSFDGNPLRLGTDWLPSSDSPSLHLSSIPVYKTQPDSIPSYVLYLDDLSKVHFSQDSLSSLRSRGVKALLIPKEVLFHSLSARVSPIPIIYISKQVPLPKTLSVNYSTQLKKYEGRNVFGFHKHPSADSTLLLMAHYDHLGTLGSLIFNGANDNASGVAACLDIYEHLVKNSTLPYNILVAFWDGEEAGLQGSFFSGPSIMKKFNPFFYLNIDMLASATQGFMIQGGNDHSQWYTTLINTELHETYVLKKRNHAPNSDHWFFKQMNTPGFYIYSSGGTQPYHSFNDDFETLQRQVYQDGVNLIVRIIENI